MRIAISIVCGMVIALFCVQLSAAEVVEHNGKMGLWFEEDAAKRLLQKEVDYDNLQLKLKLLELKMDEMEVLLTVAKRQRDLESEMALNWKNAFSDESALRLKEQTRYESIINKKEKWYRSPIFWGCVGFIVGSAATIGIAYSLEGAYK